MIATLSLPLSAYELRDAVRHSRPFNPARLDRVLRLDTSRSVVEVQASATWASLAAYLRPAARELSVQWAEGPTIAQSVAANAAGPDGRPTVAYVEGMALVTPDSELRKVSRSSSPELFALAVGGQGLFGAAYSVTLNLESLAAAAAKATAPATLAIAGENLTGRALRLLVPPESLEKFLAEARNLCAGWRVAIDAVEVHRTLAEDETVLRWARREYAAVALRLAEPPALGGCVRSTQLRRQLIDAAIAHGGSFPIACTPEASRAQTETCYPELKRFLAEKRRLDPAERLVNDWYRHHRSMLGRESCPVRWTR